MWSISINYIDRLKRRDKDVFVSKFHDAVCSGLGTYMKHCTIKSGVEDGEGVKLGISISKGFGSLLGKIF